MAAFPSAAVHGFSSPGQYQEFCRLLDDLVRSGCIVEMAPDERDGRGEVWGGRWFYRVATGEKWRLAEPDFPFRGLWEKV